MTTEDIAAGGKAMAKKRIVLCADGTWNERDQIDDGSGKRRPTNVTKVARSILARSSDVDQVVFYHNGLGTSGRLDRITGGAFGEGICTNVMNLYRSLVYNYVDGDEIYMFGFSRGAFTIRTLAGFMKKFGLLQKDDDYYAPDVFALYENFQGAGSPEWRKLFGARQSPHEEIAPGSGGDQGRISGTRACPRIRMIGAWDTVGSLGAPGIGRYVHGSKYQFHDVALGDHIQNAYHALAIDEHRAPFEPTLWTKPQNWAGDDLQQVWFCGVHSNVGGSYGLDGLANEALHWMVEKAEALGLAFDSKMLESFKPCFNSVYNESMDAGYRAVGLLHHLKTGGLLYRKIGAHQQHGEAIHQSVIDRWKLGKAPYRPDDKAKLVERLYRPENLKPHMNGDQCKLLVVNTGRIFRDRACSPLTIG